ncbi:uncharacterized protein LOC127138954 [Lates calcarifer]|uniref:Uncharacterized protein LOC127138954 n=1 Tax=Lates calcarifer TaxID=8187 RepID=A0AAJ8BIS5_LATCA|nr:uncharacterized protein LOC127138954 [Lates calcarifer]
MDDLSYPFNQKTLDFYFRLLLLLRNVMHSQSFMQHCPVRTAGSGFPNFTSEAGSPFSFKLPLPATLGHTQHYQLSLVDGDGTLPHWMVFGQQSRSLSGLALTEDCGIYHLTVSVTGEKCAAFFYLNILNKTLTDKDPARESLSCSEGEMTIWANLVLQLNPVTLDASQRLRLVSTMADYLHLPMGSVCLLSSQQQKLRVCRQGGLSEKPDVSDVAELLWPVGCQAEERQSDLARVLEHSVKAGGLARLLEAPVSGWRMLCAPGGLRQKVKRDLQRPKFAPAPNVKLDHSLAYSLPLKLEPSLSTISWQRNLKDAKLEPVHAEDSTDQQSPREHVFKTLTQRSDIDKETNHTQEVHSASTSLLLFEQTGFHPNSEDQSVCVDSICSHLNWYSFCNSQELLKQTGLSATKIKPVVEGNGCREQVSHVSEAFWTTELFSSLFLPEHESTVRHFLGEPSVFPTLLPSPTPHSVYPSQPLTPASYSVASTLTHEAGDGESHATRLTLRPHLKETSLWTEHYRANHTDSERQPTVSSQGHVIFSQEPPEEPSVSHPPLTENYNDILLLNSRLKPIQSPPSSNRILTTQLFPDVSPTSYLTAEQLSISPQTGTIQHLSPAPSGVNQDVMSQLNATTQGESSTALTGQLTLSGQTELESSLSSFVLEPSVMTPALPSEFGLYSGQRETLNITNPEFSDEFLKASSSFISLSLLPDICASSLHQTLGSKAAMDFCSDRNEQTQTLISGVSLTSVLPVEIPSSIKTPQIISVPLTMFKDQTSVKSAHESSPFIPSVQQTLVRETDNSSYLFSVPGNTTVKLGQTVTYPLLLSVSKTTDPVSDSHFDPTAPSTAQQPHTTSPVHLIQSLEPLFPLCGQSMAKDHVFVSGCTPPIKSTYVENTLEDVLTFLTSYSGDERHWTTTFTVIALAND